MLFAGVVAGVYAASLALVGQLPHLDRASPVAIGLTLDMVVIVPLAFYLLVVRRRNVPIITLIPVFVLSVVAASRVLPADHQGTLRVAEVLAVPLELGLIGWIVWRARTALRKGRGDKGADPLEQFRRAALELTRNDRAAAMIATEIAVLYYAFGAWRARPHAPAGTSAFSHHRRSGHAGIVLVFLLVMLVEGFAVHLLLLQWSALAAWIFTIGTVYGALWLIADYRATVLRPILVSDEGILVRAGFRCTMHVPHGRIADVGRRKPATGKGIANLTLLGNPTFWLILSEPMPAQGPYGFRRLVNTIGIQPDMTEDFGRVLDSRLVHQDDSPTTRYREEP
ncbi:MAG: hypothetical protein ACRELU_00865 [Gemmatimonadota bacterium]